MGVLLLGGNMATASVMVRSAGGPVPNVLVELFSVPAEFRAQLPVRDREKLLELKTIQRLGSAVTDARGWAGIDYGTDARGDSRGEAPAYNLWLLVSASSEDGEPAIAYQARDVRVAAAPVEQFAVFLPAEAVPPPASPESSGAASAEALLATRAGLLKVTSAMRGAVRAQLGQRTEVGEAFRTGIAPHLIAEISTVERGADGTALDADYVAPDASARERAEARIAEALWTRFAQGAPESLVLHGRVSLTDSQAQAIRQQHTVDPATNTVELSVAALDEVLRGGAPVTSGDRPAVASVSRVEVVENYCLPPTAAEICLEGGTTRGGAADGGTEGGTGAGDSPGGDPGEVTVAELTARLPGYMAALLDEQTVLDAGFGRLPAPGSQLSEDAIGAAVGFPSLVLPPGPADVAVLHEFHQLQIAFRPVWSEALDDSLLTDAEAAYHRYVELGGDPTVLQDGTRWGDFVATLGTVLSPGSTPPPAAVAGLVELSLDEWSAMPVEHQDRLYAIALQAAGIQAMVQTDGVGSHKFLDGLNDDDQKAFDSMVQYVATRIAAYRTEAERLVSFGRAELERRAATESPVPASRILSELRTRARNQYPARYFAANRQGCSVNFGLLLTYAQRWTPTTYQVGELIKTIPLAPKETRRYSKKIVIKKKRARKEVESNLTTQRSETQSTSRADTDIVQKAMQKTNFNATVSGTFDIGIAEGQGDSTLGADSQSDSSESKKNFHESVVKAASEYRDELKVELETETSFESEFQESGEITNPNDELTVTYLFYELQRRYRVAERLRRLTSVVLVAQEMPQPADLDEDWLIANRWILNRVLLDDVFRQPLTYVAEKMAAEEYALTELKRALVAQSHLVEDLKGQVADSRQATESRYAALQRSMERTAEAAQHSSDDSSSGLLGFAKQFTTLGAVDSLSGRLFGSDNEAPEAARTREAATRDAYERELERLSDLEGRLAQENNTLAVATKEYTDRLSAHLGEVVRVTELINHVKTNILYYMQAIWLHEPPDQRWMRLKDVQVPNFYDTGARLTLHLDPVPGALSSIAHLKTRSYDIDVRCGIKPADPLPTVPLTELADLDDLLGFKANYMIFAMKQPNMITSFMMTPYVDRAPGGFTVIDPDDAGNMTLDEFGDYVCCLRKKLTPAGFDELRQTLEAQLGVLFRQSLRDDEIVVPRDALFIEALPGAHPLLENFKLLHRQIDAADAQENLRLKKMEKLRYVQRLLGGDVDDPSVTARYIFDGATTATVTPPAPSGGSTSP